MKLGRNPHFQYLEDTIIIEVGENRIEDFNKHKNLQFIPFLLFLGFIFWISSIQEILSTLPLLLVFLIIFLVRVFNLNIKISAIAVKRASIIEIKIFESFGINFFIIKRHKRVPLFSQISKQQSEILELIRELKQNDISVRLNEDLEKRIGEMM